MSIATFLRDRLLPHPVPYLHSLDTKLLTFARRDHFSTRDACSSVQILGGTGSGKTSGSAKSLARAYLRAGFGGLVCCVKTEEANTWRRLAKECNREGDLVFIDSSGDHRFNFLDYAQATIGKDGFDSNIVDLLSRVTEAAKSLKSSRGGSAGDNQFFKDASQQMLANCIPFLRVAYGTIRLRDLYNFITSTPRAHEETTGDEWLARSFCAATMKAAGDKAAAGNADARRVCEEHGDYWLQELPGIGDRTLGSIISTLTSTIYPFLSGKMAELFTTHTTLVPEIAREGAIIVMDLPTRKFSVAGAISQQIFKLLFQQAMENEPVRDNDKTRPVFLWADECQFVMNSYDAEHLSVCRQQKVCNVFITQDIPTYFSYIGDHDTAHALLNKFGTRIFHATTDKETATYAAEVIGKTDRYNQTISQSTGQNTGGGTQVGEEHGSGSSGFGVNQGWQTGYTTYQDYDIKPQDFGLLRTGGPANRLIVEGIVIINGRQFRSSGKNRIKVEFHQK